MAIVIKILNEVIKRRLATSNPNTNIHLSEFWMTKVHEYIENMAGSSATKYRTKFSVQYNHALGVYLLQNGEHENYPMDDDVEEVIYDLLRRKEDE